jgi:hypothetical protein
LLLLEGVYRSSRDRLAATVPADKIEGFHSFTLAALARYTAPISQDIGTPVDILGTRAAPGLYDDVEGEALPPVMLLLLCVDA